MSNEFSLLGFATFAAAMSVRIDHAKHHALEEGAKIIEKEAKRVLGTDGYNWTPLSPHTHKTQPGILLERAEMHDSIEHNVDPPHFGVMEAHVGSNNDKAVWQELGTSGPRPIPPRSFLMGAAVAKEKEIAHEIGAHIVKMITP